MSFSRGDSDDIKLTDSSFDTTAPKGRKDSLQNSQLQYRIPDIQIHIPEDDSYTVFSEKPSANSETDAESRSQFQRDRIEKIDSGTSHQSIFHTTEQKSSHVSSITSLPDISNYVVIPNKDSSRNLPPKTNSAQSISRSNIFENSIQEGDEVSRNSNNAKKYERKSSLLTSEIPADKQRRKSVVDLASFMQPRKSIIELTPAMQARISVFETIQNQQIKSDTENNQILDQDETILERRKSILDEIPNMERRRSIRAEVLELERRYLSGDERSNNSLPDTRNEEIQALQRRRSIRNEILSFEHRGSMHENTITPPSCPREDNEVSLHYKSIQSNVSEGNNEVFGPEKGISIKRKIREKEQRESAKETDESFMDEYQQGKQKDTTEIQTQSFTSDGEYSDTEEQYIRSVKPYLKYRKSISDLEPYFKHQSEAFRLSSSVQEEIARCEEITNDGENESKSGRESQSALKMQWIIDETAPNLEYENSICDNMPFNIPNEYNFELKNPDKNLNERECQNENEYENMHYTDSRRSSRNSFTIRERQLSSGDSRPIEKVSGNQQDIKYTKEKSISNDTFSRLEEQKWFKDSPLNNANYFHGDQLSEEVSHINTHTYLGERPCSPNNTSNESALRSHLQVDGDQDIIRKRLSEHQKSIAMEEMESIARKLSKDPINDSERNLTGTTSSDKSYDISYETNNQNSLSLGDVQMLSKKNSISGSLNSQSDSLQSTGESLGNQIPDHDTDINQRRNSIALEVLDFISRRLSNALDVSNENPTFAEKDEQEFQEDYSSIPQDSISPEETYQAQSRTISDMDYHMGSRASISSKGNSNSPRLSISLEETKNSPRRSISQNSDKLDAEDIILYDQRRKSVTMDALNFMVQKFSSEPIPDHQSKRSNNNPEHEEDLHKSELEESSHRNSRSSDQSDHRLSRSSTSLKEGNRSQRGSITFESEQRSQRGSISSEYENNTQRNFFVNEEANRSQRGSNTNNDYVISHTEPILLERGEMSSKNTMTVKDEGPHKGSISDQGNQRSPRGSISLQDTQISYQESGLQNEGDRSPRGSISIDECQRSLTGLSKDGQRSKRNSLYEDQVKSQNRSPEGITPNDTHEIKFDSLKDETYKEQRRESIGMDILGFIARRFSNVSENEHTNQIPSIIVKEYKDSQVYGSSNENQRPITSSSQDYRRDSRFINEEDDSSRKSSISTRDGLRGQRGSVSVEDDYISRKGSTVSDNGKRSSKGSILQDGQWSQRGSISAEEEKGYYNELKEGQTSRRGSASTDYVPQSQRESFSLEARQMSPGRSASPDVGQRSDKESLSLVDHRSYPRQSITTEDESQGSIAAQDIYRSSRSSVQSNHRNSRGSISQWESEEECYRSQRGSIIIEKEQGSQRGSISSEYEHKPRSNSISYKDGNRSHRGSITVDDYPLSHNRSTSVDDSQRSRKNSVAMDDGRSQKGSISDQVSQRSPRGSITLQETQTTYQGHGSPRGSISSEEIHRSSQVAKSIDEGQISHSGSVSTQYRHISQMNSFYDELVKSRDRPSVGTIANANQDEKYDNTYEKQSQNSKGMDILGFIKRRFSNVSENEHRNSIPSITVEEHKDGQAYELHQESRRSSSSSSENYSRSSIDDHQRSQRDANFLDEEAVSSRKNSMLTKNEHRSQRGSVSSEDYHISRRGSSVSDNGKRSSKGSLMYDGQGSQRGSISTDESKGYYNESLTMEEGQTSRRGSASPDYDRQSQRESSSLEPRKMSLGGSVSADDGQGSRKGSLSLVNHRSHHRQSLPDDDETYQSISDQDIRRSSTSSNRVSHRSPRGSICLQETQSLYQEPELFNDGKGYPRGSISSEDSHRSCQITEPIDESQKSRSGSISIQKSPRNSLYDDQVKFQDRSPEGIPPNNTKDEKYNSLKDETNGEERRKPIGMDILGFIARRFSNASENELSNSINSITVKEHRDSQAYESPHESRRSSNSSSQNYHRSSIDNNQWSQRNTAFLDEEAVSSRRSSISNKDGHRSHRGSLLAEDTPISRKVSTVSDNDKRSSQGLISYHGQGSRRGSISTDESKRYYNDSLTMEESQTSRRGSASPNYGRQSQRESFSLEPRKMSLGGSVSPDDGQRSRKGSLLLVDHRSHHRQSLPDDETYQSISDQDIRRSSTSSNRVSHRSPRGSICLQYTQSLYQEPELFNDGKGYPRGSISSEDSHRSCQITESIDESQKSRSGSISIQKSPRNSLYDDQVKFQDRSPEGIPPNNTKDEKYNSLKDATNGEERRKSIGMDILGFIARRFSNASENELGNSINSITVKEHRDSQVYESPHESRRSSNSSSQNYHRSSIDDNQWSQRNTTLLDEEAVSSRRSSISNKDGHRSHRGSLLAEDTPISRKVSTVSDNDKRSSQGLISYHGQGSRRGSISTDESKRYYNDSLTMEESQTSRRGSASPNYGRQSQRESFSLEPRKMSLGGSVSPDDGQGSRKGSLSLVNHRSHHRQSLPDDDETYQSISDQDIRRSSTSSNRVSHRSPRGSICLQETQSLYQEPELFNDGKGYPRGSISSEDSHRSCQITESIDESQKSRSGSISIQKSPRNSLYDDQVKFQDRSPEGIPPNNTKDEKYNSLKDATNGEERRKSIGMDILGFIARRFSNASENELSNSINSITVQENRDSQAYESPNESKISSNSSSQNYQRSSIDNNQWLQRDATFLDEAVSSRKSSISNRDGHRSQRGSLQAEDNHISRRSSTVSDNDKRSSKGLIEYHGQGSQRGSISAEEHEEYYNDSLSMERSNISRRGSASADYGQQSQRESFTLELGRMSQDDMREIHASLEETIDFSKTCEKTYNDSQFIAKSDSEPNDMYEKYKMYGNVPNETPDVVLHHYVQRSFSEETPDIIDYGSDSESGSELNFDLALTEIESGIQSTTLVNENQSNKYKIRVHQSEIPFTNAHKDEGVTPDLYEALYGHIITLLTLPELGGMEHELCATFIPDITLESSINDTEWIEISQKNKNITGSPTSSIIQMSSLTMLDKKGGWTAVDALQDHKKRKPLDSISTVTFCGCGFLGVYLVGAATYLQERAPHVLHGRLAGSSVGSLIATCLACDVPLEYVRKNILATADVAQKYFMGPFNPFFPIEEPLLKNLLKMIPEDGHIRASGRLFLSLTRATTLTNEIVSEYSSRDELVRAILCCCFLPFISGFTVPSFNGRKYIDGGMSNNMPLKGPNTLSINAFSGEFDICPEDPDGAVRPLATAFNQSIQMTNNNLTRLVHALLPPSSEMLDQHFQQGYSDAKKYFSK